ncbi:hypothetical protein CEXT_445281 [Caerostris extrusa]|uniref:Uncharacterized protein n=1 Tax=Caerostris extrusa TaxID=172846 RepID=A0AAV4XF86_CAEEX|nr:hypothetical protein CEXT_445281 [Caerostris extrusa]
MKTLRLKFLQMLLYKYGLEPEFSRIWNSSAHVDGNKRDVPPAGIGRDLFEKKMKENKCRSSRTFLKEGCDLILNYSRSFIKEFGAFYLPTGQDLDEFQSSSADATNLLFIFLSRKNIPRYFVQESECGCNRNCQRSLELVSRPRVNRLS